MQLNTIRDERSGDAEDIDRVIKAAFADHPHSNQREHFLVRRLRDCRALTLSLVTERHGEIIAHVAFSPVQIGGAFLGWHGLGPVAVRPEFQRQGVGVALINVGLNRLRMLHSNGCVLLGEPAYYQRFGFRADPRLWLSGVPPEFFLILPFQNVVPTGCIDYHPAFSEVTGNQEKRVEP
jgi:putative acetyltransferase